METNQIIVTLVTIALLLLLYYLATYEKKKQEKEIKKMQENLKEGDKIISYTGLTGIIKEVLEDRVIILLNPNKMEISLEKWAIAGIDERNIYEADKTADAKKTETTDTKMAETASRKEDTKETEMKTEEKKNNK